jgi:hypothetical protein
MKLENLRENLLDMVEDVYLEPDLLKQGLVTVEDTADQLIFEGIKYAYDETADKKSIRQHLIDNGMDPEIDKRKYSRALEYAQYYRDEQYNRMIESYEKTIDELQGKDMDAFNKRLEGHELNCMQFFELCNMSDIPLLKKIVGKQISDSKKVSNTKFREYFDEYDALVQSLFDGMDSNEKTVFNTIAYFVLEWKYGVEAIYNLTLEAEKHGYPEIPLVRIGWMCGVMNMPGVEWFPHDIGEESRFVYHRNTYAPFIYNATDADWKTYDAVMQDMYRVKLSIQFCESTKSITDIIKGISISERVEFLHKRYWLWDKRTKKDWTDSRIKYARELYKAIFMNIQQPKIK